MSNVYVPTTEQVRAAYEYVYSHDRGDGRDGAPEEFDAWMEQVTGSLKERESQR